MSCEICGEKIYGRSSRVIVDGAKMTVCNKCSSYGKAYWEPVSTSVGRGKMRKSTPRIKKRPEQQLDDFEIVENYGIKIRDAREKLRLKQEELAKLAKERLSIIQKVEAEKIFPELKLTRTLEHILRVKLISTEIQSIDKDIKSKVAMSTSENQRNLTIGDIIHFKKKLDK